MTGHDTHWYRWINPVDLRPGDQIRTRGGWLPPVHTTQKGERWNTAIVSTQDGPTAVYGPHPIRIRRPRPT